MIFPVRRLSCLEIHPRHTAAHLLEAQICITQENYRGAESALDEALAYNFAVRSCVLYKLIKAQLSAKQVRIARPEYVLPYRQHG